MIYNVAHYLLVNYKQFKEKFLYNLHYMEKNLYGKLKRPTGIWFIEKIKAHQHDEALTTQVHLNYQTSF